MPIPETYKPKDTEVVTWKNKVLDDFMKGEIGEEEFVERYNRLGLTIGLL